MTEKFYAFTLGDLELALTNLIEKRLASLHKSNVGKGYEGNLRKKLGQIQKLPTELKDGQPLSARLEAADGRHDAYIEVIINALNTALSDPEAPTEQKQAAKKILDSVPFKPSDKTEDYATEASTAKKREDTIFALEPEFKRFPLSGNRTLFQSAKGYIESAKLIDALLEERAKANAHSKQERSGFREIRPTTIRVLNQFRASLADELEGSDSLPQDIDDQVFSYFDELHKNRVALTKNRAETKNKAEQKAQAEKDTDPKPGT